MRHGRFTGGERWLVVLVLLIAPAGTVRAGDKEAELRAVIEEQRLLLERQARENDELRRHVEALRQGPAAEEADGKAAPCPPEAAAAGGDKKEGGQEGCKPPEPFWSLLPPVTPFPRPGWFPTTPAGPGFYSLLDVLTQDGQEGPPKYPYPRFGLIQFSFFDADWRYLDKPDNKEHDPFDFLKRIRLGEDFLFTTGGDVRLRYASEDSGRLTGTYNSYTLLRTRVYGDLLYQDRARLYAEFIDAHSFNEDLAPLVIDENRHDFLNLFVDLKLCEVHNSPVLFRTGRQELLYGSQRLISPLDWANTRRTFQGLKLFRRGEKLDVDLFCVQPVVADPSNFDSVDNDQVFSGLWTTYRPGKGRAIDAYYLNLDQTRAGPVVQGLAPGPFNVHTVGGRFVGDANNWLWDVEGAVQFGERGDQSILANAATAGVGYHFKDCPGSPQAWLYYDCASGDDNPGAGNTYNTFNQLFPFGHYYFGYVDAVGRQNIHDVNGQFTVYPTKWITAFVQFHVFRLDSPTDALYNAAGAPTRRDASGQAGTEVGEELDFVLNFHLSKHTDVYLSYSHLYAGDFLRRTGNPRSPDYFFLQYSYRW